MKRYLQIVFVTNRIRQFAESETIADFRKYTKYFSESCAAFITVRNEYAGV
jgi:hypothetical protein